MAPLEGKMLTNNSKLIPMLAIQDISEEPYEKNKAQNVIVVEKDTL